MKVIFFIGSLRVGGAERVAMRLCDAFTEKLKWDVTLLTGDKISTDFYICEHAKRASLSFDYARSCSVLEQFKRVLRFRAFVTYNQPDLIILSSTDSALRGLFSLIGLDVKTIVCEHNHYYHVKSKLKKVLRNMLYPLANKVFLLTERDIKNYPKSIQIRSVVMVNPLGVEPIMNNRQFNYKLLAVGRLIWNKGYDRLLEIFSRLDAKYTLTIVGDGDLNLDLKTLSNTLGVADRVSFVGTTTNVSEYYNTACLLLVTSRCEGLPLVIPEANSFGLPVVSYDCDTGPRELIRNGENGYLIKEGHSAEFIQSIRDLANDSVSYQHMSDASRKEAEKYSINNIVNLWRNQVKVLN